MAYSKISYIGDGSTTSYTTPSYIEKSHIAVWVDGNLSFEHSWTGPNTITFNTAPSAGAVIEIVRNSSQQTRLVNYQQPSPFDAETLNRDSKQAFYMAQEALDEASGSLGRTPDGTSYDAEGRSIINVGSPANSSDAATKAYVDMAVGTGVPGGPTELFTVADYTELRGLTSAAYAANRVFVTAPYPGEFWHDANDTTSEDNGGVIIVDASGRRWKRLEFFSGYVSPSWWGASPTADGATNRAAINMMLEKYTITYGVYGPVLRFTTRGTYLIDGPLVINFINYDLMSFHLDFNGSTIKQQANNAPILQIRGGVPARFRIENGRLQYQTKQTTADTDSACIAFVDNPSDSVSNNGPHNSEIQHMVLTKGYVGIGVMPTPESTKYTTWDMRIEYCYMEDMSGPYVKTGAEPVGTAGSKNMLFKSSYIQDNYQSGTTGPILSIFNTNWFTLDDVEIIQTSRVVMQAQDSSVRISSVAIENPSVLGDPGSEFTSTYMFRFDYCQAIIDSLHVSNVKFKRNAPNPGPLIYLWGLENIDPTCDIHNIKFSGCSISGTGFLPIVAGTNSGVCKTTIHSPVSYRDTDKSLFPLFVYDTNQSGNYISRQANVIPTRSIGGTGSATGSFDWLVQDGVTDLNITTVQSSKLDVNIRPYSYSDPTYKPYNIGNGTIARVTRRNGGAGAIELKSNGVIIASIPGGSNGSIEIMWYQLAGSWVLVNVSTW